MNRFRLTRERKIILVVGTLVLLLGLGYRLSSGLQASFDMKDDLSLKKEKIAKYTAKASLKDVIEKRLVTARKTLTNAETVLLSGDTEALAAVDIQNTLNEIAFRSKVELTATRVLKSEKLAHEGYLGIRVEINFSASIRQIKEIIYRIETSGKWLEIPNSSYYVSDSQNPEKITANMVVGGIMKIADI